MYDKHLLGIETRLIKQHIDGNSSILDAGCGEGEGTAEYAKIPGVSVTGVDFSEVRLQFAAERTRNMPNVRLLQMDLMNDIVPERQYDVIISQRFIINILDWDQQKQVIRRLTSFLGHNGKLILLEGSKDGVNQLNNLRAAFGLEAIPVKWHNLFFDDDALTAFCLDLKLRLAATNGMGTYFALTRAVRPAIENQTNWDCEFNRLAATDDARKHLNIDNRFSRLKLWVFQKT